MAGTDLFQINSAIHKAAGQAFSRLERPPEAVPGVVPAASSMGVSGIVPGKIMEQHGTVRPVAL